MHTQVRTYRSELGELRTTLNAEVEQLRTEFQDLRTTLRQQLEATAALANEEPIEVRARLTRAHAHACRPTRIHTRA